MIVEVAEAGDRPAVLTKARMNAPQGVKALGMIFAAQDWADKVNILLDWQPEELSQSEYKNDAIVRVHVMKRVPPGRLLNLTENFDVNDIFTLDQLTRDDFIWIVDGFKDKMEAELKRAGVH